MVFFPHRHLIGIKGLTEQDITFLLDKADEAVKISRQREKKTSTLRGLTQINLFFEASTRTQSSFELAGKRLGADVLLAVERATSAELGARAPLEVAQPLGERGELTILVGRDGLASARRGPARGPVEERRVLQRVAHQARSSAGGDLRIARIRSPER